MFLLLGMILITVAFTDTPISYAEKRECKDLIIKNQKKLSRNL
jgi:hypothetical protein